VAAPVSRSYTEKQLSVLLIPKQARLWLVDRGQGQIYHYGALECAGFLRVGRPSPQSEDLKAYFAET